MIYIYNNNIYLAIILHFLHIFYITHYYLILKNKLLFVFCNQQTATAAYTYFIVSYTHTF